MTADRPGVCPDGFLFAVPSNKRECVNMEPIILDGTKLAKELEADYLSRAARIKEKTGVVPVLATILVGDNPSSVTYVRMKGNACVRVGIESKKITLPEQSTTDDVIRSIESLNSDERIYGILLQHPAPKHIDE